MRPRLALAALLPGTIGASGNVDQTALTIIVRSLPDSNLLVSSAQHAEGGVVRLRQPLILSLDVNAGAADNIFLENPYEFRACVQIGPSAPLCRSMEDMVNGVGASFPNIDNLPSCEIQAVTAWLERAQPEASSNGAAIANQHFHLTSVPFMPLLMVGSDFEELFVSAGYSGGLDSTTDGCGSDRFEGGSGGILSLQLQSLRQPSVEVSSRSVNPAQALKLAQPFSIAVDIDLNRATRDSLPKDFHSYRVCTRVGHRVPRCLPLGAVGKHFENVNTLPAGIVSTVMAWLERPEGPLGSSASMAVSIPLVSSHGEATQNLHLNMSSISLSSKTAVCIVGESRDLDYSLPLLRERLVDANEATVVYVSDGYGGSTDYVYSKLQQHGIHPAAVHMVLDEKIKTNQYRKYMRKAEACAELLSLFSGYDARRFDLVIRVRPDLAVFDDLKVSLLEEEGQILIQRKNGTAFRAPSSTFIVPDLTAFCVNDFMSVSTYAVFQRIFGNKASAPSMNAPRTANGEEMLLQFLMAAKVVPLRLPLPLEMSRRRCLDDSCRRSGEMYLKNCSLMDEVVRGTRPCLRLSEGFKVTNSPSALLRERHGYFLCEENEVV